MNPSRYGPGQLSANRKSRLEGKPSLLPKPRRPGSIDRLSTEARRPSAVGHRSSSAEPPRVAFGAPSRLSREASATKLPLSRRSRSQSAMTPLRSSQYSGRATTTPQRTPSEDRMTRSWQASLDRVLAFVTVKDQRPISNVAWQRAECSRVQNALADRGVTGGGGAGGMALIRPLTIARFVDIAGALLTAISPKVKLNNDNYVTKLPHQAKRFLYPGIVSKSWLKTVNTLHAFPHALALLAYLLDLVNHIETPIDDDWLYVAKDELARLRRDYLYKSWLRFQEPECSEFTDLTEEYLQGVTLLLGNDEEKIAELQLQIKQYESCLEDETEVSARAEEARRAGRRGALAGALRGVRGARGDHRAAAGAQRARRAGLREGLRGLDAEIERATLQSAQVQCELESQTMSVEDRMKMLEEVDYAHRVTDSKRALAKQISKMVLNKETELSLWQNKMLEACMEYKHGLIHLSAQFPQLVHLAIDEKELMGTECALLVSEAITAIRECSSSLAERRAEHSRNKTATARKRNMLLEETRQTIANLKASISQEQETLTNESSQAAVAANTWINELKDINEKIELLNVQQNEYKRIDDDLDYWEKMEEQWRLKLISMKEYIECQQAESQRLLQSAISKRVALVSDKIGLWNDKLSI